MDHRELQQPEQDSPTVDQIIDDLTLFDDGSHIIYVNGSYQGDDPVGKLVHDFSCKRSDEMYYNELANGVRHFKETEGGRKIMCQAVEEYVEKKRLDTLFDTIKNLMQSMKWTADQAMDAMKVSQADQAILAKRL